MESPQFLHRPVALSVQQKEAQQTTAGSALRRARPRHDPPVPAADRRVAVPWKSPLRKHPASQSAESLHYARGSAEARIQNSDLVLSSVAALATTRDTRFDEMEDWEVWEDHEEESRMLWGICMTINGEQRPQWTL
jgi:hypothetical protein